MKLPADLNPVITERMLAGGTPVWDVTLTFNETEHVYTVTELSDFTSVQVLLKAMDDGYGETWKAVADDTPPTPQPFIEESEKAVKTEILEELPVETTVPAKKAAASKS